MKRNKQPARPWPRLALQLLIVLCSLFVSPAKAQDIMPVALAPQSALAPLDTLFVYSERTDTIAVPAYALPRAFQQVGENVLTDSLDVLAPFWQKLRLVRLGLQTDTVRIVHVGDSHIRGHIFPRTTGELMQQTFGCLTYTDVGINGAACVTFTRPDRIAQIARLQPDLLILSFGTNESHSRAYNHTSHYQQMTDLLAMLRTRLPNVPILLTTPPGSYESNRRRGRQRTYKVNPRTAIAVDNIHRFAANNGLAVWDMYTILGGADRACLNWQEAGLMRPDHVHYMPEGYTLQGQLFYQALLRSANQHLKTDNR